MKVEIISIGTELLYNDVLDVNASRVTTCIRDVNAQLTCKVTIGDDVDMIVEAITLGLHRANVVLTIGGLGNDANDWTGLAVLQVLNITSILQLHNTPGVITLEGGGPGPNGYLIPIQDKLLICLPGGRRKVAYLMETAVLPWLKEKQAKNISHSRTALVHTAGLVESDIRQRLEQIPLNDQEHITLNTFAGQTDIRLWVEATSLEQVESRLRTLKQILYTQLGDHIYGEGESRLEQVVLHELHNQQLKLAVAECSSAPTLRRMLTPFASDDLVTFLSPHHQQEISKQLGLAPEVARLELSRWSRQVAGPLREYTGADLGLVVVNQVLPGGIHLLTTLSSPKGFSVVQRTFGGHPENIADWSLTLSLVLLRRWLLGNQESFVNQVQTTNKEPFLLKKL